MDKKAQKADAWKKIQEEMKDRRTSKKKSYVASLSLRLSLSWAMVILVLEGLFLRWSK